MIKRDVLNKFCWVLNVLDSCENESQIQTSQNLFNNFLKLYDMKDSHIITFKKVFDDEINLKLYNLSRNTKKSNRLKLSVSLQTYFLTSTINKYKIL